jgi:hypothetical protein
MERVRVDDLKMCLRSATEPATPRIAFLRSNGFGGGGLS